MTCAGPVVLEKDGLCAIDCVDHGYVHLDPLPSQAELDRLYRDEYYQLHHAGWFEKESHELWYWGRVYRQRARLHKELLKDSVLEWGALDYGAGCGWFHKAVTDDWRQDYLCEAYEPSAAARQFARDRLDIKMWSSFDLEVSGLVFDFIHCSLVLEHLLDPLDTLKDIHKRMVSGAVLCIVVPNEFNPLQLEMARRYDYSPLGHHHLNYFTPATLTRLVERAGFEVVRTTSTFPIEWFALHGLNYVKHPKIGILAHWIRMVVESAALTIAPAWWERIKDGWAAKGIGREAEIWARKSSSRVQVGGWGFPREMAEEMEKENK